MQKEKRVLRELLDNKQLVVCVGSGGVGKTTVSAGLALSAAMVGKKALVVTIDPARRLANALGFEEFGNEEFEVDISPLSVDGEPIKGKLFAMMLDQKRTFDELVDRYAPTAESARRLKENPWYQQMSTALAGAQDYMAVEKLYEMARERDYDLIVLDTPPTANALDFLEAPQRLMDMLQLQPVQWFQRKMSSEGRTSRFLKWGGASLLKAMGRVIGSEVVDEISALLQDLSMLYDGFRERAEETWGLLRSEQCCFFLVSVAHRAPLLEALFFHQKLLETRMPFAGFWLNRSKGFFFDGNSWVALPDDEKLYSSEQLEKIADDLSGATAPKEQVLLLLEHLTAQFLIERDVSEQARKEVVFLRERVGKESFVGLIPAIQEELHDLNGLTTISRILLRDGVGHSSDLSS